jgi:hypothetical protein
MGSTIRNLELEGVPLRTSLRVGLKQLDLGYSIQDGYLQITSVENVPPVYEDPFLIGGHCVLTLIAAALGGALAPLVAAPSRETR